MRESAGDLLSADPVLGEVDLRWPGVSLSRCQLAKRTVRPGCVVVAPGQDHQAGEQTAHEQVDAREDHSGMIPARKPGQARSSNRAPQGSVVRGHCACYAVPGNSKAIRAFRDQVTGHWHRALRRRSQRTRLNWERMDRLADRWLPPARIRHPWPSVRFDARTQGRSPVR